ncbi:ATPase, T2SS/T4P/T4SS family [Pseudomonas syringae pv. coryli]|uniref:ATPase, T2SS/T4P/T4SS family n=1 Tax=Pseudomonas syringae pv. coryli TaxID=317659 RepID=UPI003D26C483
MQTLMNAQIRDAIQRRQTILVVGTTGSGRTQLLYEMADEAAALFPGEGVAVLCEIDERVKAVPDNLTVYASLSRSSVGSRQVSPDIRKANRWLFADELRDNAAGLLDAWRLGHAGAAALHGSTVDKALTRLEEIVAPVAGAAAKRLTGSIDIVVLLEITDEGRQIKDIKVLNHTPRLRLV